MANNDDCIRIVPGRPVVTPSSWIGGAWTGVDLSAYDPNGHAVHAILEVAIDVANVNDFIYARKGDTGVGVSAAIRIRTVAIDASLTTAYVTAIVSLDSGRTIDVYKGDTNDVVAIRLVGFLYGTSYVKRIDAPVDKTPASANVWSTVDITANLAGGDSGSVLAAVVHFAAENIKGGVFANGLRHPSSTDTNRIHVGLYSDFYGLVKCNSSNQFQAYVNSSVANCKLYVLGYIKTGGKLVMHTDPQSNQTTVTCGSVQTVDLTSLTSANARVVALRSSAAAVGGAFRSDRWFAHPDETHQTARIIGSTGMSFFAGLNSTQDVEAYVVDGFDASEVFDVVGYVETESQSQSTTKETATSAAKTPAAPSRCQYPGKLTATSAVKDPTGSRVQYADKSSALSLGKAPTVIHAILAPISTALSGGLTGQTNMAVSAPVLSLSVAGLDADLAPGAVTLSADLATLVLSASSPSVGQSVYAGLAEVLASPLDPVVIQTVFADIASGASRALDAGLSLAEVRLTPEAVSVALAALDAGIAAGAFTVVVDAVAGPDGAVLEVSVSIGGLSIVAPSAVVSVSVLDGSIMTLVRAAAAAAASSRALAASALPGAVTLSGGLASASSMVLAAGLQSVFTFTPAALSILSSGLSAGIVIAPLTLLAVKVAAATAVLEAVCYRVFGQVGAKSEAISGPAAHGAAMEAAGASMGALVHSHQDGEALSSAATDGSAMTSSSAVDEEAF